MYGPARMSGAASAPKASSRRCSPAAPGCTVRPGHGPTTAISRYLHCSEGVQFIRSTSMSYRHRVVGSWALLACDTQPRWQSSSNKLGCVKSSSWVSPGTPFGSEAEDGYDTVEWCAAAEWCDGLVGTMGGSYAGSDQSALATLAPPHLAAMVVEACCTMTLCSHVWLFSAPEASCVHRTAVHVVAPPHSFLDSILRGETRLWMPECLMPECLCRLGRVTTSSTRCGTTARSSNASPSTPCGVC